VKKLLITLVIVVGLLIGADFGGRAIAESRAAKTLAERSDVTNADVQIHGFPFLTQAISGSYGHITLTANGVELGTVPTQATVDAYDVRYPLSDAVHGTTDNITAGRAVVAVRTPTSSFSTLLHAPGVTLAAGDQGRVRVTTSVKVAGHSVPITADASVSVTKGVLHTKPGPVSFAGIDSTVLPAGVQAAATKALTFDIPLDGLPVDVQSGTLTVDSGDMVVSAELHDVALADLM
jgi:hypothetical protein